jgi:hypothetical protein
MRRQRPREEHHIQRAREIIDQPTLAHEHARILGGAAPRQT